MKKIIIKLDKSSLLIKTGESLDLKLTHDDLYEVIEDGDTVFITEIKKSLFKKARVELVLSDKLDSLDITSNSYVELKDVDFVEGYIKGNSDDVELDNVTGVISNISTTLGDVYIKSSKIEQLTVNSEEGDFFINIKGNEDDYHIEFAGMGDRKLAHNFLKLNSDGNIDYTFEL